MKTERRGRGGPVRAMSVKGKELVTRKIVAKVRGHQKSEKLRDKKDPFGFGIRGSGVLLEVLTRL